MRKFSLNKEINKLVKILLKKSWQYRSGRKHDILIAPNNRRCSIPSSPSDYRATQNFYQDVDRLF